MDDSAVVDRVVMRYRRRRSVEVEAAAERWVAEFLGGRARLGARSADGETGEVWMLVAVPAGRLGGIAPWRWAAAALVAEDPLDFFDRQAMAEAAMEAPERPGFEVRCLSSRHFADCWNGEAYLPLGGGRFEGPPGDAPENAPAEVLGA